MPARLFSDAERAWLALTYPLHRADFTTELFNECWGRDLTKDQIVRAAKRFGLGPSAHDGRFRKGNVPPNKGRKGYSPPGSEKGWFRKGGESPNTRPLYSERWDNLSNGKGKTTVLMIKVPGAAPYASQRRAGAHQNKPVLAEQAVDIESGIVYAAGDDYVLAEIEWSDKSPAGPALVALCEAASDGLEDLTRTGDDC